MFDLVMLFNRFIRTWMLSLINRLLKSFLIELEFVINLLEITAVGGSCDILVAPLLSDVWIKEQYELVLHISQYYSNHLDSQKNSNNCFKKNCPFFKLGIQSFFWGVATVCVYSTLFLPVILLTILAAAKHLSLKIIEKWSPRPPFRDAQAFVLHRI